jgi:hypothetical protein
MCESCLMPFDTDPGQRESNRCCSYCFKGGKLCYVGNDPKEFQRVAHETMVRNGMDHPQARFFTWMTRFAPCWKH